MEINIAVSKTNKYAVSESGDTVEIVERPHGGISLAMADGQSSGHGAKRISNLVVRKVISLLAEGVRDGAAARAASDYLYNERRGKVSATLNIVSVDLVTNTIVTTRNNPAPLIVAVKNHVYTIDSPSVPIGIYPNTRPEIHQIPLEENLIVVAFTDGLIHAGARLGTPIDLLSLFGKLLDQNQSCLQDLADSLLLSALTLDQGRPVDDISVAIIGALPDRSTDNIRKMSVRFPI